MLAEKRIGGAVASRYNSRIVSTRPLVILLALCLALACHAQAAPQDVEQEFASRIVALTGPGAATLTVVNASSANAEQFASFRKTLQHNLQEDGVRVRQSAQANSDIRVTLSENARGLVYVAEVQQGSETRQVIVEATLVTSATLPASAMTLRRTLLVSRVEPVLDAVQLRVGNEAKLVLLTAQAVVLYRQQAGTWVEQASLKVVHGQRLPQDLRGRLVVSSERTVDAYLPGVICQVSVADALRTECRDADDAWPMGAQAAFFNSAANYFNGLLRPGFGKQMAPFFTAAALPFPGYTLWIFNGVDGQVRTHDGVRQGTLNVRDWGSDVAAVRSGCGSGTQLLVTGMADAGANDSLRGFELVDRQPVLAAPTMEFNGAITALWTAQDGLSATAVLHNPRTESYEVFNVSIGCNQ